MNGSERMRIAVMFSNIKLSGILIVKVKISLRKLMLSKLLTVYAPNHLFNLRKLTVNDQVVELTVPLCLKLSL
jgi:hypothetical protein